MKHAILLLANGFEEVEAVTQIDYLRRAGTEVRILGISGRDIVSSRKLHIRADGVLSEAETERPDAVIFPGGLTGALNLSRSREARKLAEDVAAAGGLIAAICASPAVVLAPWGMIKGKKYTCYPDMEKDLEKYCGPAWKSLTEGSQWTAERVVRDGMLITSRGAGTAEEFAFEIIRCLEGTDKAAEISAGIVAR